MFCFKILYLKNEHEVYFEYNKDNQHIHSCPWYNKHVKLIPWILFLSVFIKHQKWNNTTVLFLRHFSDRLNYFITKGICQIDFNVFLERLVNVQFSIQHISNLKLMHFFVFLFIHYHFIYNMPNRQTMLCNQQIPQLNWFVIVPIFRCLHFHIIFLCLIQFFIKRRSIFQCKKITLFWKRNFVEFLISAFLSYKYSSHSLLFFIRLIHVFVKFNVFSPCERSV